jgi:hypothetical protein
MKHTTEEISLPSLAALVRQHPYFVVAQPA